MLYGIWGLAAGMMAAGVFEPRVQGAVLFSAGAIVAAIGMAASYIKN